MLFYLHFLILFLFGAFLTFLFAGIEINKKNSIIILIFLMISGSLQLLFNHLYGSDFVWWIYPFTTHLPLFLVLVLCFRKHFITSLVSLTTAYLCCQPANWFGTIVNEITNHSDLEYLIRIIILIISGVIFYFLSHLLSQIFNKDNRTVTIFGIVPIVYYIYDYSMSIYTNYWTINNRIVLEFLPLFLCFIYMIFNVVYYREQELRIEAKENEQILRISLEQQNKDIEEIKSHENKIRLLRHDMRLILNNIAMYIENNDSENALKIISDYIQEVDSTTIKRYCKNDIINCVLSSYANKFQEHQISFDINIMIDELNIEELPFSSILSNGLDNAFNATKSLPIHKRNVKVMLKKNNDKYLLSIKNTYSKKPKFINGKPISKEIGHGYGTQSINYVTKRLNGNCQFLLQDEYFVLRVII